MMMKVTKFRKENIVKCPLLGDYWMAIKDFQEDGGVSLNALMTNNNPIKAKIDEIERVEISEKVWNSTYFRFLFHFYDKEGNALNEQMFNELFKKESDNVVRKNFYDEPNPKIMFGAFEIKGLMEMIKEGKTFYLDELQNYLNDSQGETEVNIRKFYI